MTFNLRDFPAPILLPYGITAVSPDVFLAELFVTQAENICLAFERQLKSLENPPTMRNELLQTLAANGMTA